MPRNDRTFLSLYDHVASLNYDNKWVDKTDSKHINAILNHASKMKNGNVGMPDLLYINHEKKILIMIELKTTINQHKTEAIPEIKHYLNCFTRSYLSTFQDIDVEISDALMNMVHWNILGIAVSGDIKINNGHLVDTYHLTIDKIEDLAINDIRDEEDYVSLFQNVNLEAISERITEAAIKINNLLYDIKEEKRPTLLSILMISLFETKNVPNHFRDDFSKYENNTILDMIRINISNILGEKGENLPTSKIEMITTEIDVLKRELVLNTTDILKTILLILRESVIPLFKSKSNYDIIGKFYQEFLRYAGVVDVQSGIVLTPEHVTNLFTELVYLKKDDIVLDTCCGTGSFLIAAMNKLVDMQSSKKERENVKSNQIIGNEYKSHMYILAISNMIFRGDGKSNLLNHDFFSKEFDDDFSKLVTKIGQPTIGFINPPYSGSFTDTAELDEFRRRPNSKSKKPWMKEISFLKKTLDICSRYVVAIIPPQALMSEEEIRDLILKNNTLKAVINMPKELFEPNASTGSSIVVFETRKPHNYKNNVIFYNLDDDGYVLTKKKGRRDVYNKWNGIKKNLLSSIDAPHYLRPNIIDQFKQINVKITFGDEWVLEAHSKVDYTKIQHEFFLKVLKEKVITDTKRSFGLINKDYNEVDLIDIFINIEPGSVINQSIRLNERSYGLFSLYRLFKLSHGERITKKDRNPGDIPLITAGKYDNGIKEFISNDTGKIQYSNCFHMDMFGNIFYDDFEFVCDDNIYPLIPNDDISPSLNKYNSIFILSVLKFMLKDKFDYTRQLREKRIAKDINIQLSLPVDENGNIDYEFMTNFIKTLKYSSAL